MTRHRRERKPKRVRPPLVDHFERVNHIALRLRHLLPMLIADKRVDIHVFKGDLAHKKLTRKHHPRYPEKDDVIASNQYGCGIVSVEFVRLFRPSKHRKGPQR